MTKAEERALKAWPITMVTIKDSYGNPVPYDGACLNRDIYIEGYEQAEKDAKIAPMKSPLTGGVVTIHEEEKTFNFRGEDYTITRKYYRCEDTGKEFSDSKLDGDMMWALFRAYWERKGFERFSDIDGYKEDEK